MRKVLQRGVLSAYCLLTLTACDTLTQWLDTETDPRHEALAEIEPRIPVDELWSRDIGGGAVDLRIVRSPRALYAADERGRVFAYTLDGRLAWQQDFNLPTSFALGGNSRLLILGGADGRLIALSGKDGRERWRAKLGSAIGAISTVRFGMLVARTADQRIVGLSARDGRIVWTQDATKGILTIRGMSAPLLYRNLALVGLDDGHLVIFNLRTGEQLNRIRIAPRLRDQNALDQIADIDGYMAIRDHVLFVASYRGPLMAINLKEWGVLWTAEVGSDSGPLVASRAVYAVDTDGGVVALDRLSGEELWRNTLLEVKRLAYPATAGGFVVAGDEDGYLYWLSPRDGQVLRRSSAGSGEVLSLRGLPNRRVAALTAGGDLAIFQVGNAAQ